MYGGGVVTHRCGHTEYERVVTDRTGRNGRDYIKWRLAQMEEDDCTKCRMENGTTAKIRMRYVEGKFYGEIMSCDSYFYKDILKEAGMKYHYGYDWCFVFKDRFYKAELDSKIELLRKKKIIITEVEEDGVLDEELRFLKQNACNKCVERVISEAPEYLQPYLRGEVEDLPKEHTGEYERIYTSFNEEISRIKSMSVSQVEVYLSGVTEPMSEQEVEELKALRKSAVMEVREVLLINAPGFTVEGRCSKRVYGSSGTHVVFIDNTKRKLSNKEYKEFKRYKWGAECFRRLKEKIMTMNLEQLREKKYMEKVEEEELRRDAKIEAQTKIILAPPDCIRGYYWNGKYYGSSKRVIYRDDEHYTLSDQEFQSIQDYKKSIRKCKDVIKKIDDMSADDLREKLYNKFFASDSENAD